MDENQCSQTNTLEPILDSRVVFFMTGNIHKYEEAIGVLRLHDITIAMFQRGSRLEIQCERIENIAKTSVMTAVQKYELPMVVEDAGLFIEALNGFPGPYSSYVYKTVGNKGVLKLLKHNPSREAYFKSVVAFSCSEMEQPIYFIGEVKGRIAEKAMGNGGFGFDPIFKPNGSSKTFAQMTSDVKGYFSHRAKAFSRFAKWFLMNLKPPQKS